MTSPSPARAALATRTAAKSAVTGLGVYIPSESLPSARRVEGPACTGVSDRVQPGHGLTTPFLAASAARAALMASKVSPDSIELIIVGTTSPDVLWPATACLVQTELGLPLTAAFDLYAAQAGVLTALSVADRYMAAGVKTALVIGAESDNPLVDVPRHQPAAGRAAAAIVLRRADGDSGLLACVIGGAASADGGAHDAILLGGLTQAVERCLKKASLELADVDLVIGEQTAPDVMRNWAGMQSFSPERLLLDPTRYRRGFAATPLIALHDAVRERQLRPGMTALLVSCGTGPAWAVACLRWADGEIAAW